MHVDVWGSSPTHRACNPPYLPRIVKEELFQDNGTLLAAFVPDYLANKLAHYTEGGAPATAA